MQFLPNSCVTAYILCLFNALSHVSCLFSVKLPTPNSGDILLDFSKNRINDDIFKALLDLVSAGVTRPLPSLVGWRGVQSS